MSILFFTACGFGEPGGDRLVTSMPRRIPAAPCVRADWVRSRVGVGRIRRPPRTDAGALIRLYGERAPRPTCLPEPSSTPPRPAPPLAPPRPWLRLTGTAPPLTAPLPSNPRPCSPAPAAPPSRPVPSFTARPFFEDPPPSAQPLTARPSFPRPRPSPAPRPLRPGQAHPEARAVGPRAFCVGPGPRRALSPPQPRAEGRTHARTPLGGGGTLCRLAG